MTLDPQLVTSAATFGAGYLMIRAGIEKHALVWKRRKRICPSCRHDARDCRCRPGRG